MPSVSVDRDGEGLSAAVLSEIERLDLGNVYSCRFDTRTAKLKLVLRRSKLGRDYAAETNSLESIYEHLRTYARVRSALTARLAA